jgi:hypothetical protein
MTIKSGSVSHSQSKDTKRTSRSVTVELDSVARKAADNLSKSKLRKAVQRDRELIDSAFDSK